MRKSKRVHVWLVTSVAAAVAASGCVSDGYRKDALDDEVGQSQPLRCVEKGTSKVVAEDRCDDERVARGGHVYPYAWYYGGTGGYRRGTGVSGGSFQAADGTAYRTSSGKVRLGTSGGVSRGGFGRTGGSFGGGLRVGA